MQVGMRQRVAWMQSNLVSCDCPLQPSRKLSYDECATQGSGCRQCRNFTEYHDDEQQRCVPCGSLCVPGYVSNTNCSAANASTAVARTLASTLEQQAYLGCRPCAGTMPGQQYVVGCNYTCLRDASVANNSLDYYCNVRQTQQGHCPGRCLRCAASFATMSTQLSSKQPFGWFLKGCSDVSGHDLAPCTNRLPANSHFTSNAQGVGNSTGCDWGCNDFASKGVDGASCYLCPASSDRPLTCQSGEQRTACYHNSYEFQRGWESWFCDACAGGLDVWKNLQDSLTRLYSDNPWDRCYEDCQVSPLFSLISPNSFALAIGLSLALTIAFA
jgi:hypothetical protein